jgi:hypothetical protein
MLPAIVSKRILRGNAVPVVLFSPLVPQHLEEEIVNCPRVLALHTFHCLDGQVLLCVSG